MKGCAKMGFAVIHMEKYKVNDVRGIQSHNNRERKSKSNQDIDYEKSSENYHLLKCDNYTNKILDTIYENATESKTIRKDAVVLCSFIITSDNATMTKMSPEVERDFFEKSVEFISERYGKEGGFTINLSKINSPVSCRIKKTSFLFCNVIAKLIKS